MKPRSPQARINRVTLSGCRPPANRTRPKMGVPAAEDRQRL